MNVERCKHMFHGLKIDPVTGLRRRDALLYERLKHKMPVEVKVLPPPKVRLGFVKYRKLIVYMYKLDILEGWWKV